MKHLPFLLLIALSINSYGQNAAKATAKKGSSTHGSYFIDTTFVVDPITGEQIMKFSKGNTDKALKELDKRRKTGDITDSYYVEQRKYILSASHK